MDSGPDPRSLAAELHRIRGILNAQNARFKLVLEKMRQGLCLFDGSARLIVANRRYAELYGIASESIQPGMELREIVDLRVAAGSLPQMTQAQYLQWRNGVAAANKPTDSIVELRNGRVIHIHHEPLADFGWVATHDDITDQRRAEDELRRRNLHFDAAIANMSQGLCMFDANERMIVCNLNYPTMFGMSPEFVRPGISLHDILRHSVEIGVAAASVEELYQFRREIIAARLPTTYCETLSDGRIIDIWHRPMADGGWVSTYDDVTEKRRAESRIAHMATHDALTDLPNRAALRERLSQLHSLEAQGSARATAVLLLDLDRFKEVNDTMGHAAGDRLLHMVAGRLRSLLGDAGLAARLGGDEFAVLHPVENVQDAALLSERIIAALRAPYDLDGHQADIDASIGIALTPSNGWDPETLLKCADLALYRAKARGRGGFAFFESEMTDPTRDRRALEQELRAALVLGQFEAHYQPLINLRTGNVSGAEALIRWRHPARGLIGPSEFLPVAEEIGLSAPIGEWMLRQACRDAARWRKGARVAVNLCAAQVRSDHLAETVISALAAGGLPPAWLELEIGESILVEGTGSALNTLQHLRSLGVRVSLDDFGAGRTSFGQLQWFPFDKIKIDRSFVREIAANARSAAIVRAIAGLAANLGMEMMAKGVETEEQLDLIRAEGCTEVQGFYFSPPRPANELAPFLGSSVEGRPDRSGLARRA